MTIGMLVESLAGKAGALHGIFEDSTPFKFGEKNTAVSYFGEQLLKAGYNYYGNEPMYSGVFGCDVHQSMDLYPYPYIYISLTMRSTARSLHATSTLALYTTSVCVTW